MMQTTTQTIGLVIFLFIVNFQDGECGDPDHCADAKLLPNLNIRYPGYVVDPKIEPYVDDFYIYDKWYNVGERKLLSGWISYNRCGTKFPVYAKDNSTIPVGKEIFQTVYYFNFYGKDTPIGNISVKNCGNHRIYKLIPLSHEQGYCFVGINSTINPHETAPSEMVSSNPEVTYEIRHSDPLPTTGVQFPYYSFGCKLNPVKDKGLFYQVHWFLNGQRIYVSPASLYTEIHRTRLDDHIIENFGFRIQCLVRLTKSENGPPGKPSPISNSFFVGIEVLNKSISMKTEEEKKILIRPTVPFGCPKLPGVLPDVCSIYIDMRTLQHDYTCKAIISHKKVDINGKNCGIKIESSEWNKTHTFTIYGMKTMNYISTGTMSYEVQLSINGESFFQRLWRNYSLHRVNVQLRDDTGDTWQGNSCSARVDPHICTFDGLHYDNQNEGTFVMYRNTKTKFGILEVQIKTSHCRGNHRLQGHPIYCICGVAVRAGQDVYRYDRCNIEVRPIMEYRTCDSDYLDVRRTNDKEYHIFFPTGTSVKTLLQFNDEFMDVEIYPSLADINNTEGLCGKINDNKHDDLMRYQGSSPDDISKLLKQTIYERRPDGFSLSWSVPTQQRLLDIDRYQLIQELNSNNNGYQKITLCTCTNTAQNPVDSVTCSGDAIVECSRAASAKFHVRKDICNRKKQITRTRRFTHLPDNFVPFHREERTTIRRKRDATLTNITIPIAKEICEKYMHESAAFLQCNKVPQINPKHAIDQCIADIMLTGTLEWRLSAREGQKSTCMKELVQNQTLQEKKSDGTPSIAEQITEISCQNECSGHGECRNGTCICQWPQGSSDCSLDLTKPPIVYGINLDEGGICDTTECDAAFVIGDNFVDSENLTCHRHHYEIDINETVHDIGSDNINGDFQTLSEVHCSLSNITRKSTVAENTGVNPFVRKMTISMSNDGNSFGDNHTLYILDSTCQDSLSVNGTLVFALKPNWCFIRGECFHDQEIYDNDKKTICDVSNDRFEWTVIPDTTTMDTTMADTTTQKSTPTTKSLTSELAMQNTIDTTFGITNTKTSESLIVTRDFTTVNWRTSDEKEMTKPHFSMSTNRPVHYKVSTTHETGESASTPNQHKSTRVPTVQNGHTTDNSLTEKDTESKSSKLWIIGIVLGGCAVLLLSVVLFFVRKRATNNVPDGPPPPYEMSEHTNAGFVDKEHKKYDLEEESGSAFKIPRPARLLAYDKKEYM